MIGCSSSRKIKNSGSLAGVEPANTYAYSDLIESGVSNDGFFIRKLRIVSEIDGNRDSYTANLRKSIDGQWLASIQLLRVEVFRVYADRENVIILDRLGRSANIISWETVTTKYGVTFDQLPALLGDIPRLSRQAQKGINCKELTRFQSGNVKYEILADCSIPRAKEMIISSISTGRTINMRAEEYGLTDGKYYTSVISVREISGAIDLSLFIEDITIPWDGEIEFSIPSGYKIYR